MMDESMIGRVAEAIRLRGIDRGHPVQPVVLRHLAVAAIEAMREPTGEMKDAGADTLKFNPLTVTAEVDLTGFPSTTWQTMIAAALSEFCCVGRKS